MEPEANVMPLRLRSLGQRLVLTAALMATPLIIFLSTTNSLFLKNQRYFSGEFYLYLPFLGLFLVVWFLALMVFGKGRQDLVRALLWVYLLAGPVFMVMTFVRTNYADLSVPLKALVPLILFAAAAGVVVRFKLERSLPGFALLGALILGGELVLLTSADLSPRLVKETREPDLSAIGPALNPTLPNVYHLVLDGFQTDLLLEQLSPGLARELSGFTVYPHNVTAYEATELSTAALFLGKLYDFSVPVGAFLAESRSSAVSLTGLLTNADYLTVGFQYSGLAAGFEVDVDFSKYYYLTPEPVDNGRIFRQLWLSSFVPKDIRNLAREWGLLTSSEAPSLTTDSVLASYRALEHFTAKDAFLPAAGRYTYFHALLPHSPFVFTADCHLVDPLSSVDLTDQTYCTTRLFLDFVRALRNERRFTDSLIIIQGDHGWNYRPEGSSMTDHEARSRALLLIKPPGRDSGDPLRISEQRTSTLDIAPTVLAMLGLAPQPDHQGIALLGTRTSTPRTRYYFDYDDIPGESEATAYRFRRHVVAADDTLTLDAEIDLRGKWQDR